MLLLAPRYTFVERHKTSSVLPAVAFLLGVVFLFKTFFWTEKQEPTAAPHRREALRRFGVQTASMIAVTGFAAILFHTVSEIGFLKNPTAVAEVSRRYYAAVVASHTTGDCRLFDRSDIC